MIEARPDLCRTASSTTPPEAPLLSEEQSRAAQAAVRVVRETRIAEKYGSFEKAVDSVLRLPGWRATEDRLADTGYEGFLRHHVGAHPERMVRR